MQVAWHDQGQVYAIIRSVFAKGYFYTHDWETDHFKLLFTPIFYLLAPVTYVTGVLGFGIFHSLALSVGGLFYAGIFRALGFNERAVVLALGLYFLNPFVAAANASTHFEVLFFTTALGLAYAILTQRRWLFIVALALSLSIKQDTWVYCLAILPLVYRRENRGLCIAAAVICVLYYALILEGFYVHAYPDRIDRMQDVWPFAQTKGELVLWLIEHPGFVLARLFRERTFYTFLIFGFAPLLVGLRGALTLGIYLLWVSSSPANRSYLHYYYGYVVVPLFLLAVPQALLKLGTRLKPKLMQRYSVPRLLGVLMLFNVMVLFNHKAPEPRLAPMLRAVDARGLHVASLQRLKARTEGAEKPLSDFFLAPYILPNDNISITFEQARRASIKDLGYSHIVLQTERADYHVPASRTRAWIKELSEDPAWDLEKIGSIYVFRRRG